ncbi:MAG: NAD(P)-dependent oxidoreductase [Gammaproteobacteria bacterium]
MTIKVVFTGPQEATAWLEEVLGSGFAVIHVEAEATPVARGLQQADVFLDASMKVPLTAAMINEARSLQLLITATTGADHIDTQALEACGIPLKTLRGQGEFLRNITPAAELTWLLMMACARRLRGAIRHVQGGGWDRQQFPGMMLHGRTLGGVGAGRIGTWVSRYGQAFGMRTIGYDPFLQQFPETIEKRTLEQVFSEADCVALTLTFSEATRGLVSATELQQMKADAVLINTSRGAIVHEQDLLDGLQQGRPAFYGTDVLEGEPDIEQSPIWQYARDHDNVVITPHIGGFSPDALQRVLRFTAERIVTFLDQD